MKRPNLFVKVATVASSVLLVAGFVSYRAGAFNWLVGRDATPAAPTFLGGSKSKVLVEPPAATSSPGSAVLVKSAPAFMSSSKSIILVDPPPPVVTVPSTACPTAPVSGPEVP